MVKKTSAKTANHVNPRIAADASNAVPKSFYALALENLKTALSTALKLSWIVICLLGAALVVKEVSSDLVVIEPISAPKALSESGLTPEVVSHRLNDALNVFAKNAGSRMQAPSLAARDDLPKIVVPKIDLPLDIIVASIQQLFHYGSRRISGELTVHDKLVWLRLRIDSEEVYSSPKGIDVEKFDDVLTAAVPSLIDKIRPYLIAAAMYDSDRKRAVQKADHIVTNLPDSDVNVPWAYILLGRSLIDREEYAKAETVLRVAVGLNFKNALAHNNLGLALDQQGRLDEAIAEYRVAIKIDPKFTYPYVNLGTALNRQKKPDEAIAEYQHAIRIDPGYVNAYTDLGNVLNQTGKTDAAIEAFRHALEIDPNNALAKFNLESVPGQQKPQSKR
jgi:tetratricopeptide (TPR) repeat protein